MKQSHIVSVKGARRSSKDKITVVILASMPGYRMKSYGAIPLLTLGSHTLIDIQIAAIKSVYPNNEIVLCCGFESDRVAKYIKNKYKTDNIRIVENQKYDQTNSCESLRLCLNNIHADSLLVCNGEVLLYPELLKVQKDSPYLITHTDNRKKSVFEIGSFCDESGKVTNISFGLPNLWSEIFYMSNEDAIEQLRKIVSHEQYRDKFVFEALNEFNRTSRYGMEQHYTKGEVVKINNIKTYHKIREYYENIGTKLFVRNFN